MQWVETTGRTIDEAKESALTQLGIADDEAEFEIIEEPSTGLFGRTRGEARVRARVKPTTPRSKTDRRDRRGRGDGGRGEGRSEGRGDGRLVAAVDGDRKHAVGRRMPLQRGCEIEDGHGVALREQGCDEAAADAAAASQDGNSHDVGLTGRAPRPAISSRGTGRQRAGRTGSTSSR